MTHGAPAGDRGQLVLVSSLVLALALVTLGVAYLQLGYHEDIEAAGHEPAQQLESVLEQALHDASADIPASYDWSERTGAVETVRSELRTTKATLETTRLSDGHVYSIAVNETRADTWAAHNCPSDSSRQFGDCTAVEGVVVQERHDRTHVLAAAFDVEITTPDGETWMRTVVEIQAT